MISQDEVHAWKQCPMCDYKFAVSGTPFAMSLFSSMIYDSHMDTHVDAFRIEMMNL